MKITSTFLIFLVIVLVIVVGVGIYGLLGHVEKRVRRPDPDEGHQDGDPGR